MQVQLDFGQAGFKELCTCLYFEFKQQLPGKTLKSDKKKKKISVVLVGFYNVKGCGFLHSAKA